MARKASVGEANAVLGKAAKRRTSFAHVEYRTMCRTGVGFEAQTFQPLGSWLEDDCRALAGRKRLVRAHCIRGFEQRTPVDHSRHRARIGHRRFWLWRRR